MYLHRPKDTTKHQNSFISIWKKKTAQSILLKECRSLVNANTSCTQSSLCGNTIYTGAGPHARIIDRILVKGLTLSDLETLLHTLSSSRSNLQSTIHSPPSSCASPTAPTADLNPPTNDWLSSKTISLCNWNSSSLVNRSVRQYRLIAMSSIVDSLTFFCSTGTSGFFFFAKCFDLRNFFSYKWTKEAKLYTCNLGELPYSG